jgi:hypothetical protein
LKGEKKIVKEGETGKKNQIQKPTQIKKIGTKYDRLQNYKRMKMKKKRFNFRN